MAIETVNQSEIFTATDEAVNELVSLMNAIDEDKINTVPYSGSWTAPQLLIHISKSFEVMANAMRQNAKPLERDPTQRIEELKTIFLDFSRKLQAPELIEPEEGIYERQATTERLESAFQQYRKNAESANLNELVEGLPLGPITKLEIIPFVLYHTQRHLHQMKKICAALKNK